jgi:mRNA-degrading endonuclease YafQ of YafQ-DinJ toxin-antitoxin module
MSGKSNRVRKSSILNRKLTGKYDRRVDYLMLKKIYGLKKVYLFEFLNPLIKERELKTIFTQNHCYHGLNGQKIEMRYQNQFMKDLKSLIGIKK